jgi:hypothetical protein
MKQKHRFTAVAAERMFGAVIVLLLVGLVADFIFVTDFLKSEAAKTEVLHKQSDATDSDITKLKSADEWMKKNEKTIERTSAIVAESKLYQYQNQIIEDLDSYGAKAGTQILGYSFSSPGVAGAAPASATPAPTTAAAPPQPATAPAGSSATPGTTKAPSNVNSTTVNISFGEKIRYQNFLNLLSLLEQNVTRMQVTQISLSPDTKQPDLLINPTVTIIVYTR